MSDSQPPMQDWNAFAEQWNETVPRGPRGQYGSAGAVRRELVGDRRRGQRRHRDLRRRRGLRSRLRDVDDRLPADGRAGERPARGRDVDIEEFRDIWLNTANEAFKEVMSTTAFAKMTGETVGDVLELQEQADEAAQETLNSLGFATEGDVVEIGDRLVELERRQHAVEQKLDRVLEHVEDKAMNNPSQPH